MSPGPLIYRSFIQTKIFREAWKKAFLGSYLILVTILVITSQLLWVKCRVERTGEGREWVSMSVCMRARTRVCVCVKERKRELDNILAINALKSYRCQQDALLHSFSPILPFCKLHYSQMRHSRDTNSEIKTYTPPVEKQTKAANVLWLKKFSNKVAVIYCPCS